jgi:hypothetical protein
MARRPRIVVEGGLYHVYNRVASGEPVFADPETVPGLYIYTSRSGLHRRPSGLTPPIGATNPASPDQGDQRKWPRGQ